MALQHCLQICPLSVRTAEFIGCRRCDVFRKSAVKNHARLIAPRGFAKKRADDTKAGGRRENRGRIASRKCSVGKYADIAMETLARYRFTAFKQTNVVSESSIIIRAANINMRYHKRVRPILIKAASNFRLKCFLFKKIISELIDEWE